MVNDLNMRLGFEDTGGICCINQKNCRGPSNFSQICWPARLVDGLEPCHYLSNTCILYIGLSKQMMTEMKINVFGREEFYMYIEHVLLLHNDSKWHFNVIKWILSFCILALNGFIARFILKLDTKTFLDR